MVKGKTKSGFEFKVSENIKKDFRIVRILRDAKSPDEDKKFDAIVNLVDVVLGDEEERFFEFIAKQNDGVVPIGIVFDEVGQILNIASSEDNEIKN